MVVLQQLLSRSLADSASALHGGDDYELCFTAPKASHDALLQLGSKLGLDLCCLGETTQDPGLVVHGLDKGILDIKELGFDHFK